MDNEVGRKDIYRTYRRAQPGLECFRVLVGETDLWVESSWDCREEAERLVKFYRRQLKSYIQTHPEFLTALNPLEDHPQAPDIVKKMIAAGRQAEVGPMAAVAGAINYYVAEGLRGRAIFSKEVGKGCAAKKRALTQTCTDLLLENGGDLLISGPQTRVIGIYAGDSPFSWRVGIRIALEEQMRKGDWCLGVCTSAGRVGPSLSMGKADAAVILSPDPVLADAVATATANRIKTPKDLEKAVDFASSIPQVIGVLLICGIKMAAWGDMQVIDLSEQKEKGEGE